MNKGNDSKSNIIRIIITVGFFIAVFFIVRNLINGNNNGIVGGNNDYEKKSIEAAEKLANQQVYETIGVAPEKLTSQVIYKETNKDEKIYLIVVKYYLRKTDGPGGAICVYCNYGYAINSTEIKHPDYPYKNYLNELKALFGI